MFILIKHYMDDDHDMSTTFVGLYETEDDAHEAMSDDFHQELDGMGKLHDGEVNDREASLFHGDMWDWDVAYQWLIFDSNEPGETFIY